MEKDAKTTSDLLHKLVQEIINQQKFVHLRNRTERAIEFISTKLGCSSSTFYKMKAGKRGFPHDILESILNLAKDDAKLDRDWGEAFLRSIGYLNHDSTTSDIWGHKQSRIVLENLPKPDHTLFVGRQEVLEKLLYWLSPKITSPIISIDGIGGVGKTALILEAAHLCLQKSQGIICDKRVPTFDAFIFITAKQQWFTSSSFLPKLGSQRTLQNIFHAIADTLDWPELKNITADEQPIKARGKLKKYRTLLIVDNLETILDQEDVLSFLHDLPKEVKVVITTRQQAVTYTPFRLSQLSKPESTKLIEHEAISKAIKLTPEQIEAIFQRTGGIPIAIIYVIGQIASGYSPATVLARLTNLDSDVVRFCFESSMNPLRNKPAHHLLMAMSLFPKAPTKEAVACVAGYHLQAEDELVRLRSLSLIEIEEEYCRLMPLTREFALAELSAQPELNRVFRKRWIDWYVDFVTKYGGRDYSDWCIRYDQLDNEWENLLAVIDWCVRDEQLDILEFFLTDIKGITDFANIYGKWNDRLVLTEIKIRLAERTSNWAVLLEALIQKSWTLILQGRYEEVRILLEQAWQLRGYASSDSAWQLPNNYAILNLKQGNFTEAEYWLGLEEEVSETVNNSEPEHTREHVTVQYYRAELAFQKQNYEQAKELYKNARILAESINWKRAVVYIDNFLADIAIAQNSLEEADDLLKTGLAILEHNKDRRRMTLYNRSYVYLEQKRGNYDKAIQRARDARDDFERLGMQPEMEELRQLIHELQLNQSFIARD